MNRKILVLLLVLCTFFSGCFEKKTTSNTLRELLVTGTKKLYIYDTTTLSAIAKYDDNLEESIIPNWISLNNSVAEVLSNGTIIPKSSGVATISAHYKDLASSIKIEVIDIEKMDILTTPQKSILSPNESLEVEAFINFSDSSIVKNSQISWEISNSNIAVLSGNTITALHPGKFTLTAFYKNLKQVSKEFEVIDISKLIINNTISEMRVGEKHLLDYNLLYTNNSIVKPEGIFIKSSNTNIVSVNENTLTANKTGSCDITVQYLDYSESFNINVLGIAAIKTNIDNKTLYPNDTFNLMPEITWSNNTKEYPQQIGVTSSNANIASVQNNYIYLYKPGNFSLTFTYKNYSFSKTYTIQDILVKDISITLLNTLELKSLYLLYPSAILEDNTTTTSCVFEYKIEPSTTAKIQNNELSLTSKGAFKLDISAKNYTKSFFFNVVDSSEDKLSLQSLTAPAKLEKNTTIQLYANLKSSSGASIQATNITWSVSDSNIASIDSKGVLTAHGAGIVTVTGKYGEITTSSQILIIQPTSISTTIPDSLYIGNSFDLDVKLIYSDNSIVDITNICTISPVDNDFVSISKNRVTAVKNGLAKLRITYQELTLDLNTSIISLPPTLKKIIISGSSFVDIFTQNSKLNALSEYSNSTLKEEYYTWSALNPDICDLQNQILLPKKGGLAKFRAEKDGVFGEFTLNVIGIKSFIMSLEKNTIDINETLLFNSLVYLDDNSTRNVSSETAISFSNNLAVFKNNLITPIDIGTTTISAIYQNFTTKATITITSKPMETNSIEIYYFSSDLTDVIYSNIDGAGFTQQSKLNSSGPLYSNFKYIKFDAKSVEFYFSDSTGTIYKNYDKNFQITSSGIYIIYKNAPILYNVTNLNAPINFLVKQVGYNAVTLSWDLQNLQVDSYNLYRSESPSGPFSKIHTTTNQLTYTDTNLYSNTKYYYKVSSFRGSDSLFEEKESPILEVITSSNPNIRGVFKVANSYGTNSEFEKVKDGFFYFTYDALKNTSSTAFILKPAAVKYKPTAMANFKITNPYRDKFSVSISNLQTGTEILFSSIAVSGEQPYPDNEISIDITSLLTSGLNTIVLSIFNFRATQTEISRLDSFSVDILDLNNSSILKKYTYDGPPASIFSDRGNMFKITNIAYTLPLNSMSKRASTINTLDTVSRDFLPNEVSRFADGIIFPKNIDSEKLISGSNFKIIDSQLMPKTKGLLSRAPTLPTALDHSKSKYFPPVGNQYPTNACSSWSVGYYTSTFYNARLNDWDLSGAAWNNNIISQEYTNKIMNPYFLYNLANFGEDGGSSIYRNALILSKFGISSYSTSESLGNNVLTWPKYEAWREAPFNKSTEMSSSETLGYTISISTNEDIELMKKALNEGSLISLSMDSSIFFKVNNINDVITEEQYSIKNTDHAMTIVGYDDNFIIE